MPTKPKNATGDFAKTPKAEQETVVRIDPVSKLAHVFTCSPSMTRRLTRQWGAPEDVRYDRDGKITTSFWSKPSRLITFRRPRQPGSGSRPGIARARQAKQAEKRPVLATNH
jgi:hypothetical protein